ncbi:LysR substrate-binding domain-containing protein [Streptomyces sp. NPDC097107]|uniref:LysR substrate-binding domain-containing protein n=1 Tax=unclassified Streptomyces TaxID=2593676 RepID=UPI001B371D9A|nr:LysR substrate-binding domain-containing protein [Streptomyces sp. b94]MBQ1094565.1 LysR family transcriptional regulator [Streptomyces sp. b94]
MFTLAQLTSFVAVAEELHFTRAAERLRMTQPPLSRQIQLLESELRVELLDRTTRSVRLTPAGRTFFNEARRILRQAHDAALAVRQVSAGQAGVVAVGFTAASAYSSLGRLLETARGAVPDADIVLREMVTRDQLEAIAEGALDLGMVRPAATTGAELVSRPAAREALLAALPVGHRLAEQSAGLHITDFDGQELLMYAPVEARYFHELLISVFRAAGVMPEFTHYLTQVHSILAMVNAGWGVALVPETAAQARFPGVVFRPVGLAAPASVELNLVWRKNNDNPALHVLLQHL